MEGSSFVFDYVNFTDVKFNRIDLIRTETYMKEDEWIKHKKATINPKNKDDKCFMYPIIIKLNHRKLGKNPGRISKKVLQQMPKYNWDNINFPAQRKDWERFERQNEHIALNIFSVPYAKKTVEIQYKSKYNRARPDQVNLLMITDNENWHYLAITSTPSLFGGITGNNNGDHCCFNCFQSYRTENALIDHEKMCDKHDHCDVVMPDKNSNLLGYEQGNQSFKAPHIIYLNLECLSVPNISCSNNPDKSYTNTVSTHVPSGYAIKVNNEYKGDFNTHYRGKDCGEKLIYDLVNTASDIVNIEKHLIIPLTEDQKTACEGCKRHYVCNKSFNTKPGNKYCKKC